MASVEKYSAQSYELHKNGKHLTQLVQQFLKCLILYDKDECNDQYFQHFLSDDEFRRDWLHIFRAILNKADDVDKVSNERNAEFLRINCEWYKRHREATDSITLLQKYVESPNAQRRADMMTKLRYFILFGLISNALFEILLLNFELLV